MIYVYFFLKCVERWSEKSVRFEKSYWNWRPDGPNSVRLYLTVWDMACMVQAHISVYTVYHSVCSFWTHYSMLKQPCSNFSVITATFGVSELIGFYGEVHCHRASLTIKVTRPRALIKGHIQRIFLNLLLFCMLTEYVQSIILLKPA